MARTTDPVALNDWQALGRVEDVPVGGVRTTRLLGQAIQVMRSETGALSGYELMDDGQPGPSL